MQLNIYAGYKKRWRSREVEEGEAWVWRSRMGEVWIGSGVGLEEQNGRGMNREWCGFEGVEWEMYE